MRFLLIPLLIFSTSAYSSQLNECQFDFAFLEAYVDARHKYAENLMVKRAHDNDHISYGKKRAKEHRHTWEKLSLYKTMTTVLKSSDVEYIVKKNGKILIFPKSMRGEGKVIIVDPSGDYFRIAKADRHANGKVYDDNDFYYDKFGNEVTGSDKQRRSHFRIAP